ncbi:hypothetical protein [Actinomadura vinacea]|uniref:hypothetical protein n=1 Tax=Actinomadura vinacea TaxID=115336 RepID=UPI0031E0A096
MTIEKIPIVTESTAAQPVVDERDDVAVPTVDIDSVLWVGERQWKRIPPNRRHLRISGGFPPSSCAPKDAVAFSRTGRPATAPRRVQRVPIGPNPDAPSLSVTADRQQRLITAAALPATTNQM